jgi:TPR repeat protein
MNENHSSALVRRPPSAVERDAPGAKRIMSGMVVDALDLAKKAASKEVAVADAQLEGWYLTGRKYFLGKGVPEDCAEAVKWYRMAAERGHADAQRILGMIYKNGDYLEKDYTEAVKWYRKAAEQGKTVAQYELGDCFECGYGVPQDDAEAAKWYRKAAEQGHSVAQCNLGQRYADGQGVPKDEAEAVKWFRRAAEKNSLRGLYALVHCYLSGRGVAKDAVEAYKWFLVAAEQRRYENISKEMNAMGTLLSPVDLEEAERRYSEFSSRKNSRKLGYTLDGHTFLVNANSVHRNI